MPLPEFRFVLAFEPSYTKMAASLIRSINAYHPDTTITIFTFAEHYRTLRQWSRDLKLRNVQVRPYRQPRELSSGEWHPLIWAKLEAFVADPETLQVVLDVDQIMYRDILTFIEKAVVGGKCISASPDITDLRGHLCESFDSQTSLESLCGVHCFNAGAMIVRPSTEAYDALIDLAERHHRHVRLPEQAILNLWAREHDSYFNLGDAFMMQPWDPRLLNDDIPSCLVHFWTPRPAFFGPNPSRSFEPDWEACLRDFEEATGSPYPVHRFENDFTKRLSEDFAAESF